MSEVWRDATAKIVFMKVFIGEEWLPDFEIVFKKPLEWALEFMDGVLCLVSQDVDLAKAKSALRSLRADTPEVVAEDFKVVKMSDCMDFLKDPGIADTMAKFRAEICQEVAPMVASLVRDFDVIKDMKLFARDDDLDDAAEYCSDKDIMMELDDAAERSERFQAMMACSRNLGDDVFGQQVRTLHMIIALVKAAAPLAKQFCGSDGSRNERRISHLMVPKLQNLRAKLKASAARMEKIETVINPFDSESFSPITHVVTALDGCEQATKVLDTFIKEARELHAMLGGSFATDCKELATKINSWSPEGWELLAEAVLDHPEVCKNLLTNKDYVNIGPAVDLLSSMRKCVRDVCSDTNGPLIDAETWRFSKAAVALGRLTVTTTFAIYQVQTALPAIGNATARATAASQLEKQMKAKLQGTALPKCLADQLEQFKTG